MLFKKSKTVLLRKENFEMNRRFKKMVAIISAIAMVITSVTVYKSADVKAAEPDWSTIEYAGDGAQGGALANKYKYYSPNGSLVNIQIPGFTNGKASFYVTFPAGISACSLGEENYDIQGAGIGIHIDAFTQKVTEFTVTYGANTETCYVYYEDGIEGETTTPDPDATTPVPTTTELKAPAAPTGLVANINDLKTNYTIAFGPVSGATSFKFYLNGEYKKDIGNGGVVTMEELGLEAGKTYTFGVSSVNAAGESEISTIQVTVPSAEEVTTPSESSGETTTAAYVDGAVLVNDSGVKEVPEYTGGDYWQAEFNNMPVTYVAGKKYVAEVVVSSNVNKKIKLIFQRVNIWDFVDANQGYEVEIPAGSKVKITYVFEATQSTDNGNFDIYLGSVAEAATLDFESKKLTTYNEVPEGVATGVEVLSTPIEPEVNVTVDGKAVTVKDGKVTLGDAQYGYLCGGKMYAPNTVVEVTGNMAFTSVNELSITMARGAGIRYLGTAGIRFQATIVSDNMDAVASEAITEGTLITAQDIYEANGQPLELTSDYTKLNVVNSGWYNGTVGTYCGSICDVVESNYIRNFTARAYVTINYENAAALTVYSDMGPVRSISQVATAVKAAGYAGIAEEYHSVIDSFIK